MAPSRGLRLRIGAPPPPWHAAASVSVGTVLAPVTPSGFYYLVTNAAGATGASAPATCTTIGQLVTDGFASENVRPGVRLQLLDAGDELRRGGPVVSQPVSRQRVPRRPERLALPGRDPGDERRLCPVVAGAARVNAGGPAVPSRRGRGRQRHLGLGLLQPLEPIPARRDFDRLDDGVHHLRPARRRWHAHRPEHQLARALPGVRARVERNADYEYQRRSKQGIGGVDRGRAGPGLGLYRRPHWPALLVRYLGHLVRHGALHRQSREQRAHGLRRRQLLVAERGELRRGRERLGQRRNGPRDRLVGDHRVRRAQQRARRLAPSGELPARHGQVRRYPGPGAQRDGVLSRGHVGQPALLLRRRPRRLRAEHVAGHDRPRHGRQSEVHRGVHDGLFADHPGAELVGPAGVEHVRHGPRPQRDRVRRPGLDLGRQLHALVSPEHRPRHERGRRRRDGGLQRPEQRSRRTGDDPGDARQHRNLRRRLQHRERRR